VALYAFFHPDLRAGDEFANRIVVAVTPWAGSSQGQNAIAAYMRAGYDVEHDRIVGGSRIVSLCNWER
jgi:hypothetical protein